MTFEKKLIFLGMQEMVFKDGHSMYTVELYEHNEGSVKVNVMDSREDILAVLCNLAFGDKVNAIFQLKPVEKAYKLSLVTVVKDGKT